MVAHNGSGYDTRLLFDEACKLGHAAKLEPILRGSKFIQLKIGKTVFLDSLLHVKGSLSKLNKDFGETKIEKGYFPYLFNTPANEDYHGVIPDVSFFDLSFTMTDEAALSDFMEWHKQQVSLGPVWNLKEQLILYGGNDVDMHANILKGYHDSAMQLTGTSPWFHATAPSYVHSSILIQMTKEMELPDRKEDMQAYKDKIASIAKTDGWPVLVPNEYWHARTALRGGMTDFRALFYEVSDKDYEEGRYIVYQDICSQYPYQQVVHDFPTGQPKIYVFDLAYYPCIQHQNSEQMREFAICPCTDKYGDKDCNIVDMVGASVSVFEEMMNLKTFFGIVTVTLTAPKDLLHPPVPVYNPKTKKNILSLRDEDLQRVPLASITLEAAVSVGYKVVAVHRYDEYTRSPSLWADMILKFYVEKLINSKDVLTQEEYEKFYHSSAILTSDEERKKASSYTPNQLQQIIKEYDDAYDIGDLIQKAVNEGRFGNFKAKRATTKTMLNSAWGKHAQRPIMTEAKVLDLELDSEEVDGLFLGFLEKQYKYQDSISLEGNKMMYRYKSDQANVNLHGGYLPAAIFVTAYGRLQLWRELHKLGKRVLYYGTDSIIYIRDPDGYNIKEGSMLGEWEREDIDIQNGGIRSFAALAPKTYALKTWKNDQSVVKVKGLSLKGAHSELVNYEVIESIAKEYLEHGEIATIHVPQRQFKYSFSNQHGIQTSNTLKALKINPSMKGKLIDGYLYPFGYEFSGE